MEVKTSTFGFQRAINVHMDVDEARTLGDFLSLISQDSIETITSANHRDDIPVGDVWLMLYEIHRALRKG